MFELAQVKPVPVEFDWVEWGPVPRIFESPPTELIDLSSTLFLTPMSLP